MVTETREITEMRYGPGGGRYQFVARSEQTGNTHFAFVATEPPGGGPPLHLHTRHEELFFVLEGEITFWIDGEVIKRFAGGSAFVLRGVPHCFKNCSGPSGARAHIVHARRHPRFFRLRQGVSKWQCTSRRSAY
jgi:quercetin dioxygenase-like cupin family protein